MRPQQRWDRLSELFEAAGTLPAAEREAFVAACADESLAVELLAMLAHEGQARTFLNEPHPDLIAPREPARFADGRRLAHRFRIERFIGRGGMGEVYEAFDEELGEPIALKTVRPEFATARMVERLKNEVRLARRIAHPNVCRLFDVAKEEGLHFLTMELLPGESLSERLRDGPLPRATALAFATQLCAALGAAHRLGIVHCDIKPANIMLVPSDDGRQRAVVMDFGLARSLSSPAGSDLTAAGSYCYMAPEQASGGAITVATDIYALGVVLHEMLTGRRPRTPLRLDRRMTRVVRRCLQANPTDRYRSCAALAGDLQPRGWLWRFGL